MKIPLSHDRRESTCTKILISIEKLNYKIMQIKLPLIPAINA